MKYLTIFLSVMFSIIFPVLNFANAAASSKVMVLDFQLNDLTDLSECTTGIRAHQLSNKDL